MSRTEYARTVEGFGSVRVDRIDPEQHAELIHRWVNEERARFWGMNGTTVEQVREIYAHLDSLTTHHGFLVHRDDVPVGIFQTYDPEADRISECYEARPGDIGVHLFVAPSAAPERGFTEQLFGALLDFALTDHTRIVGEPDAVNEKVLARLARSGFELGPEITLPEVDLPEVFIPEKRARLVFYTGA
ncbi:GNAT family N-acetyltransferase [Streptomyces sp. NBC_01268]|uniref:GNAT family N-acetyltransferase n=1 Tax=Streptomyces sp. NBC_01268 TaxID=2903806 RepID=UPI002E37AF31|nr:GNAT family N-acetyltransferase [Streptomyces sp. NBC_01268]